MSFTGIKDIDYIILDKLDNVSCKNFTKVFTEYDTQAFWKRRLTTKFQKKHGYKMDIGLKCQYVFQRGKNLGQKCSTQGWGEKNNGMFYCRQCLKKLEVKKIALSWSKCFSMIEDTNWKMYNNLRDF